MSAMHTTMIHPLQSPSHAAKPATPKKKTKNKETSVTLSPLRSSQTGCSSYVYNTTYTRLSQFRRCRVSLHRRIAQAMLSAA